MDVPPSGEQYPDAGVRWEIDRKGGKELWLVPFKGAPRRECTYLKRAGKRLLSEWQLLPLDERERVVGEWVLLTRASKTQKQENQRQERGEL